MNRLIALGFQQSVVAQAKAELARIEADTRKLELDKPRKLSLLQQVEAIRPRTTNVASDIEELRDEVEAIKASLIRNKHFTRLIQTELKSNDGIALTKLLARLRSMNAAASDPTSIALTIETSETDRGKTLTGQEMINEHLQDESLKPSEVKTSKLDAIMAEVSPPSPVSIPSAIPSSHPIMTSSSSVYRPPSPSSSSVYHPPSPAPTYYSSSSSSSSTMMMESPLELSFDERLRRLAL